MIIKWIYRIFSDWGIINCSVGYESKVKWLTCDCDWDCGCDCVFDPTGVVAYDDESVFRFGLGMNVSDGKAEVDNKDQ